MTSLDPAPPLLGRLILRHRILVECIALLFTGWGCPHSVTMTVQCDRLSLKQDTPSTSPAFPLPPALWDWGFFLLASHSLGFTWPAQPPAPFQVRTILVPAGCAAPLMRAMSQGRDQGSVSQLGNHPHFILSAWRCYCFSQKM